jgi:hypothetical protein
MYRMFFSARSLCRFDCRSKLAHGLLSGAYSFPSDEASASTSGTEAPKPVSTAEVTFQGCNCTVKQETHVRLD